MSDAARSLTHAELALIRHLLRLAEADTAGRLQEVENAQVIDMDDGGMGSLRFASSDTPRTFGSVLSEAVARDADNADVFFALVLDQHDRLFELDVWKVDFSPVSRVPALDELKPARRPLQPAK